MTKQSRLTRSTPSPLHAASNTTLYYLDPRRSFSSLSHLAQGYIVNENYLPPYIRTLLQVLLTYNSRVSELLRLSTADILPGDRLLVKGLKGSSSYIIFLPGLEGSFSGSLSNGAVRAIFPVSYMVVYRWAKKIGLDLHVGNRSNRAVTHAGRYLIARKVQNGFSDQAASDILKHRSPSNLSFYTKPSGGTNGKA